MNADELESAIPTEPLVDSLPRPDGVTPLTPTAPIEGELMARTRIVRVVQPIIQAGIERPVNSQVELREEQAQRLLQSGHVAELSEV
ncbi:MAG: hypothetical protein U1F68_15080 [Gammaproteobacteria bacterium]